MSGRRIAILVGNETFPEEAKLPDLACPLNDVDGLSKQLQNAERGGFEIVERVTDSDHAAAMRSINKFTKQAKPADTLLFYYSGHGKLDDKFALYLCSRDSEVELLESTAISMERVWDLLGKCKAQQRIVLLDCCFSGSAAGVRARGNLEDALKVNARGAGTYLLTASDAVETAQEKEGDKYGVFTKHLIAGLETGDADPNGNGNITMNDMYDYICRSVRTDSPQKPTRQFVGQGNIVIARSGKDPRKDRAEEVHRFLSEMLTNKLLDGTKLDDCVRIAGMRPTQMSEAEKKIDSAITDLMAEKCTFGTFLERYILASETTKLQDTEPPPPPPPPFKRKKTKPQRDTVKKKHTSDTEPVKKRSVFEIIGMIVVGIFVLSILSSM